MDEQSESLNEPIDYKGDMAGFIAEQIMPDIQENIRVSPPVQSHLIKPVGNVKIGNTDIDSSTKEGRWLSAYLPYSSVIKTETARYKDGQAVKDKRGETLKKVVIRVPMKVSLDGYTLGGLKMETVRPKSKLDLDEKAGEMRVAMRLDRNLKLWAKRNGERVDVTIGCDRLAEFADNLDEAGRELIDCLHEFDEVSLDDIMESKEKEASIDDGETVPIKAYGFTER